MRRSSLKLTGATLAAGVAVGVAGAGTVLAQPATAPTIGPPPGASPAVTQPVAACSAAFHRALEPIQKQRSTDLSNVLAHARRLDPELTGRWLFAAALFPPKGRQTPPPKVERECAETNSVRGQERCVRWVAKAPPAPLSEIRTKTPPPPEDLRLLRAINDVVEGKGVLTDLGSNGRHVGLVLRVSQELRGYLSQPAHPALCNGVPDMLDFYASQLSPLDRRAEEVALTAKQARTAAQGRTRDIALVELRAFERTLGELARRTGSAAVALTKAIADGKAEGLPTVPPVAVPPRPAEPASVADYAVLAPATLIREAVRPLLSSAQVAIVNAEPAPLAMLAKARALLLDPETKREPVPDDVADAALHALRMIEAAVYAERPVTRYKEVDGALDGSLSDLRDAHKRICTCRDDR